MKETELVNPLVPWDTVEIEVNQGTRTAFVLAVLSDKALLEYEMPSGSTSLRIVDRFNPI